VASQRCPQCKRIDATAKESAIVKSGTRYSTSFDTKEDASYNDNSVDWSFSFDSVTKTTQTVLAKQLSFPSTASTVAFTSWLLIIFLGLAAVVCSLIRDDTAKTGVSNSFLNFAPLTCTVGAWIALNVAVLATITSVAGRSRGRLLWEKLYYCFRDDIVYLPNELTKAVPPSRMREIIGYPLRHRQ
jgi:hypothetical protein